jgi:hypothetical protein
MGHLTTGQFVHEWVRGVLGGVAFRLAGEVPELFKAKTVYEPVWHEEGSATDALSVEKTTEP